MIDMIQQKYQKTRTHETQNVHMAKDSLKKLSVSFPDSKQARAEKSLNNLVEAAEKIVATADATGFNARTLAKLSGYSLGALVQRLGKVENIFLHAIAYGRTRKIQEASDICESFDPNKTAEDFAEFVVSFSLDEIPKVGPSIIRYYESRAMGRTQNVGDLHAYTDEIVPALLKVIERDQSGTFRQISPYEAKYLARAIFLFVERPFAESDPMAGTEQHRQMAVAQISALLKKP